MQEAIAALAQWELVQAGPVATPETLPTVTPEVEAGGARLSELLVSPAEVVTSTEGVTYSLEPIPPAQEAGGTKVMGEVIMARLDAIGSEYKTNVNQAYQALEKSPQQISLQEMMKLQLDMAVVTLEIEVVGKGVQKAVQHVDTLAKLQ